MTAQHAASGFQPIGRSLAAMPDRFASLRERDRQRRIEVIAEHGWADDVNCLRCGDTGTVPANGGGVFLCDCDIGAGIKAVKDREAKWREMIPRRLADYRLDTSPQPIIAAELSRWVASSPWHRGENLLLYGGIGTGKTGLAIGALRAAHEAGVSTELIILSDWLIKQRPSGAGLVEEDQMEIASQPSLLVIDDIGTQKDSQFTYERIYVLINRRYLAMKATIVTTNHSDRSVLSTSLGERATSRLLEQCLPIEVEGPDFREARSGSR